MFVTVTELLAPTEVTDANGPFVGRALIVSVVETAVLVHELVRQSIVYVYDPAGVVELAYANTLTPVPDPGMVVVRSMRLAVAVGPQFADTLRGCPKQVVNDGPGPCADASVGATGVGSTVSVKLATAVLEQPSELTQAIW